MIELASGFILGAVGLPVARAFLRGLREGRRPDPDPDPGGDRGTARPRADAPTFIPGVRSIEFSVGDGPPADWGPPVTRDIVIPVRVDRLNEAALKEMVATAGYSRGNSRGLDPAKVCVFSGPPSFDTLVASSTGPAVYKLVHDPGGSLEFTNASQIDFEGIPDGTVVSHLGIVAGGRIHYPQPLARAVVAEGVTCSLAPGDFHFIQREEAR